MRSLCQSQTMAIVRRRFTRYAPIKPWPPVIRMRRVCKSDLRNALKCVSSYRQSQQQTQNAPYQRVRCAKLGLWSRPSSARHHLVLDPRSAIWRRPTTNSDMRTANRLRPETRMDTHPYVENSGVCTMSLAGQPRRALITGTAGFIGFHLARRLLQDGWHVVGVDGMTPYYDINLKRARHDILRRSHGFECYEFMLEDDAALADVFSKSAPTTVVHLAAQAGVRFSLENPRAYINSNVVGTFNVMEGVRQHMPAHFLIASTSSIYGANDIMPFAERDPADHPLTIYAATKKATEGLAHAYSHLWQLPTTAFRFFTVYGPWGRPDMALFRFVKSTLAGEPIEIYGQGKMSRDFTYIDDLIEAVTRLINTVPTIGSPVNSQDSLSPVAPFRVVNIGGGQPVDLMAFVRAVEQALGQEAVKVLLPMQPGDVAATFADSSLLEHLISYRPTTPVEIGVRRFVEWYKDYLEASK